MLAGQRDQGLRRSEAQLLKLIFVCKGAQPCKCVRGTFEHVQTAVHSLKAHCSHNVCAQEGVLPHQETG